MAVTSQLLVAGPVGLLFYMVVHLWLKIISFFVLCFSLLPPPQATKMGMNDEGPFRNPVEGPAMLSIGIVGTLLNLLCLCTLRRTHELKLSPDYLFLLRLQSTFDLAYLVTSTPVTALPYAFPSFRTYYEPHVLPYVFPFVQVGQDGCCVANWHIP